MAEEEQQVNDADFEGLDEGMDNMGAEDGAAEGIDVSFANRTFCSAVGGMLVLNCISSMVACKLGYGHTVHALTALYVCVSTSLLQELEAMKQKLKELEEEAAKLRNTQVSTSSGTSASNTASPAI